MIWPFRKRTKVERHESTKPKIEQAEKDLENAESKLVQDRAKLPEIARATASARRVHYHVDQFTEEMSRSFGRLNHGPS